MRPRLSWFWFLVSVALLALLILTGRAHADASSCPDHFFGGLPPKIAQETGLTRSLCFQGFAVLHSGLTHAPVYAAEHLTKAALRRPPGRHCAFHTETKLPFHEAAHPGDYLNSGYDRGHMAPDRDMPAGTAEQESCSLANVVPQNHGLNNGTWKKLEEQVRDMAIESGDVYVVTGPFYGVFLVGHAGRVPIPAFVWKAVLDPKTGQTLVAMAANDASDEVTLIALEELEKTIGLTVFPKLGTKENDDG